MLLKLVRFAFVIAIGALLLNGAARADALVDGIGEDGQQLANGRFIVPNEQRTYIYQRAVRPLKGALISVGTFRTLVEAGQGSFSDVIMFDYDAGTTAFNRRQIEILSRSSSSADFLTRLVGGDAGLRKQIEDVLLHGARPFHVRTPFNATLSPDERLAHAAAERYVSEILLLSKSDLGSTFLTDAKAFRRVRKLARDGRLVAITGDLSGRVTLKALGDRLRSSGRALSALDLSNAYDYITSPEARARFLANLRDLPFATNAIVNFTAEAGSHGNGPFLSGFRNRGSDYWNYYSTSAASYVAAAESFAREPGPSYGEKSTYSAYIQSLVGTEADLNPRSRCWHLFAPL